MGGRGWPPSVCGVAGVRWVVWCAWGGRGAPGPSAPFPLVGARWLAGFAWGRGWGGASAPGAPRVRLPRFPWRVRLGWGCAPGCGRPALPRSPRGRPRTAPSTPAGSPAKALYTSTLRKLVVFYPSPRESGDNAPVAQGIEQRPPEPCAQVRILPGALRKKCRNTPQAAEMLSAGCFALHGRIPFRCPNMHGLSSSPVTEAPLPGRR